MFTHKKRYMVITKTWNFDNEKHGKSNYRMQPTVSYDEYDTIDEVNEHIDMVKELYHDVPSPTGIKETISKHFGTYENIPEGSYFWGYVAIDFETETIVSVGGQGDPAYNKNDLLKDSYDRQRYYDMHFRKNDEVPSDYKWDNGEYEGWLQFRWGDHKNAIGNDYTATKHKNPNKTFDMLPGGDYRPKHSTKQKPKKNFNKPYVDDTSISDADLIQDSFDDEFDKAQQKYMMDKYGW